MKITHRKLGLNKSTLRNLNARALRSVRGADDVEDPYYTAILGAYSCATCPDATCGCQIYEETRTGNTGGSGPVR
jgi:hypothetical protein